MVSETEAANRTLCRVTGKVDYNPRAIDSVFSKIGRQAAKIRVLSGISYEPMHLPGQHVSCRIKSHLVLTTSAPGSEDMSVSLDEASTIAEVQNAYEVILEKYKAIRGASEQAGAKDGPEDTATHDGQIAYFLIDFLDFEDR